jgi:chemotaxis protein MotB
MKKTVQSLAFLALILSLSLTSCGPGKKLLSSRAKVENLQIDSINTHNQLIDCNALVKNLKDDKLSLTFDKNALENDKTSLQNKNESVVNDLRNLSSQSEMTIAEQAARLKSLQAIIQAQKDVMSKLKNSIADALMNYKTDELSIYIKDGSVYVSLQEKLLFKSGSDVVDPKGKEALKSLAQVLNNTKDIYVLIEGHTDNIPIKTNQFKDNWDLSTARATSIVRILTKDNSFDPNRITASGKSEFHPVKPNDTVEGRAGNRRTEVILSPDLKELNKLLDQ